ncbi:hypothetical protein [Microbacterium hibisci]|uniref:hypothetical protein n=1 Tax=Microbacterium hibisci TaxID=2036000 RepID=UPI001942DF82|nr:hypothetical protein [Microbacterium hibisci]
MRLTYTADQRFWLHVPTEFPDEEFATIALWESAAIERYTESRPTADAAELAVVRGMIRDMQGSLTPGVDVFGLAFWPFPGPVAAFVRVDVGPPLHPGQDPIEVLLERLPLAAEPSFDEFAVPAVGDGLACRFIADGSFASGEPIAGMAVLATGPAGSVRLRSDPLPTAMVGLIDRPLRELVPTLAFGD